MAEPYPIRFNRGSDFSYLFMLPDELPEDYFETWTADARIRRQNSNLYFDKIQPVGVYHYEDGDTRRLLFYQKDTSDWPVGDLELMVRFISPLDYVLSPNPIQFSVRDGGF